MKRKLDIGCGKFKDPEFTGMDINDWPGVDIVWDLEKFPWPIEDNTFEYIMVNHVVEHINGNFSITRGNPKIIHFLLDRVLR